MFPLPAEFSLLSPVSCVLTESHPFTSPGGYGFTPVRLSDGFKTTKQSSMKPGVRMEHEFRKRRTSDWAHVREQISWWRGGARHVGGQILWWLLKALKTKTRGVLRSSPMMMSCSSVLQGWNLLWGASGSWPQCGGESSQSGVGQSRCVFLLRRLTSFNRLL